MTKVHRVEKHYIGKNHELFSLIDNYSFLSKNLYNYANYFIRQTFIITSRLSNNEEITQEQKEFLNELNLKVDIYNNKKLDKNNKIGKESKLLKYFDKNNKYVGYYFLEFLMSGSSDYKALMAQSAQQTLKLLDKNWISFFHSIKDWSKDHDKYLGRPHLPKYKKKVSGRFSVIFTNQTCKIKDIFIVFPKCFDNYKLRTRINNENNSNILKQVRINQNGAGYNIEIVYDKELSIDNAIIHMNLNYKLIYRDSSSFRNILCNL
jgi:putative transposase